MAKELKEKMNIQFFAGEKIITRANAEALIDEQFSKEIFNGIAQESVVLKVAKRLQNMTSDKTKIRVLDLLPVAGFVSGDTGLKPTSNAAWKGKEIHAEEIAVIIGIPEAVVDDASYDIIGEAKPRIVEAFGKVIDEAILFGKGKPGSWPEGLLTQITAADKNVTPEAGATTYDNIDAAMTLVEENGFMADTIVGGVGLKSKFRKMVDKNGQPIKGTEIDELNREYVRNGAWDKSLTQFFIGDWSNLVYAVRQDITYKILDQSVITDSAGKVIYNFAQQDMVGLRVVMRLGWEVPNPVTAENGTAKRFPFACVDNPAA